MKAGYRLRLSEIRMRNGLKGLSCSIGKKRGYMSKLTEQLILVLNKEQEVYDSIIKLAKDKQDAVVQNKLSHLEAIVKKEKTYAISLVKLEEIREKVLHSMVKSYDLVEINVLSDLYPFMSEKEVRQIDGMKKKLLNTVGILGQKNELNKKLIEQSLHQIEFDLNLLTTIGDGSVNYEGNASDQEAERRSIFDRKI
jgi:flagellar biosynthesis/type III secretory pathway chaperone